MLLKDGLEILKSVFENFGNSNFGDVRGGTNKFLFNVFLFFFFIGIIIGRFSIFPPSHWERYDVEAGIPLEVDDDEGGHH